MAGMYCMKDLLELSLRENAEELHFRVGEAPVMVLRGETVPIDVPVMTADNLTELIQSVATRDQLQELHRCGDIHFIYVFQNSARFAVIATMQREVFDVTIKSLGRQT
jgi:Tfp pilus assembly pilus retraction ATPase PilT